ncbi:MAG: ATP-dependent Clp protease adaptor ClpS [Burkholderiales bacterium]|nr:ATP-dependent Clp protease adaptor ClpS [Burkholderiales bacterium]
MSRTQTNTTTAVRQRIKLQKPSKWQVIFHNDDKTTMDFVVGVLMEIFDKPQDVAQDIMLKVHFEGKARAGIYTKEIAETKVEETKLLARNAGYPLVVTMERY